MSEKAIRICSKLYECRDAMRSIHGPVRYQERTHDWVTMINLVMHRDGIDVLQATMKIAEEVGKHGGNSAMLFATCVEMIEGIYALPAIGSVVKYRSTHPAHPGRVAEGHATVEQYLTAANAPAVHMRPRERMLFVRGCSGGPTQGQTFIIKSSEVVRT